jgi:hypothetical protein
MSIENWIGGLVGSGVGKAIGEVATPFTNAWVETKKAQSNVAIIDKQTDKEITVAAYQADTQLGLAQRLLDEADRTHWSTRWIRPAFSALAFVWLSTELYMWAKGIVSPIPLDPIAKYLLSGIVGSIFLLRPYEKRGRTDIVTAAQTNASRPTLLQKITGKK